MANEHSAETMKKHKGSGIRHNWIISNRMIVVNSIVIKCQILKFIY